MVIFAILTLTIFALLSMSTVQAHRRLSDNAVNSVSDYYAADCRAEQILAQLRNGETPVTGRDGIYNYSVPISDSQVLAVEVSVDGDRYSILRWQAVSSIDWQADESLKVWNGETTAEH